MEDTNIKKLEKLLGMKSDRKSYLKGFVDDGLDYLLDFCDQDKRKQMMMAEGDGEGNAWYEEDEDQVWLKQKQRVKEVNKAEEEEDPQPAKKKKNSIVKFNDQIETKFIEEDIYGRTIDNKGNLIKSKKNE